MTQEQINQKLIRCFDADPYRQTEYVDDKFIYVSGMSTGVTKDKIQSIYYRQNLEMRYRVSYIIYKTKAIWPLFDAIASYFYLILSAVILAFALYFSLAVVWAVSLTIYTISQSMSAARHYKYRKKERS